MEGSSIFKMPEGLTDLITFLHILWTTNQPVMLFINSNTPWSRSSFPYLKDIKHRDSQESKPQNVLPANPTVNAACSRLFSSSVCVKMFSISCLNGAVLFPRLRHTCFLDVCVHIPVCVPVFVCAGCATAVLLPSLSGWCMVHILLNLPALLSVMWSYGLLWLAGRGAGEEGELPWMARGSVQPQKGGWGGEGCLMYDVVHK